jgi:WD40 repeat protein
LTYGFDGMARMWNPATGHQIGAPLVGRCFLATAVMNGWPVAITDGPPNTLLVWDLTTRELVGDPLEGHTAATAVVDGRPVAVTTSQDETVRIWDLHTQKQIGELLAHTSGLVRTAVVDGRPVAVTVDPETVRIWDLATREQVGEDLVFPRDMGAVAVAPDGRVVVEFDGEVAVFAPAAPAADAQAAVVVA